MTKARPRRASPGDAAAAAAASSSLDDSSGGAASVVASPCSSRGFPFGGFARPRPVESVVHCLGTMTASIWNCSSWSSVCSRAQNIIIAPSPIPSSAAHQCHTFMNHAHHVLE
ncbi:hypothetical protein PVAP13_3KG078927 [Panicum virgatum]|uniref:Uncharacterized protein n=1 Tax=Panicum virgatum TaxID=38727 RepID=A0A8T0URH7_PANVG|nr:hypothetical protein PVAP13_3KG078927 [Panicum virgatum]KAG2623747.1 hypothetical protein PVAP13_3KG078927 [Panicum virgatum]